MTYDVRSVANYVLDLAANDGWQITNLSINKIVFFLHAHYLVHYDRPLVTAKVEAWNYGPVFRELYREFKVFHDKPISGRASRLDPATGDRDICTYSFPDDERKFLEELSRKYASLSPGALVTISHEKGGPWDQVWNHDTLVNSSMNISNDIIKSWYAKSARH